MSIVQNVCETLGKYYQQNSIEYDGFLILDSLTGNHALPLAIPFLLISVEIFRYSANLEIIHAINSNLFESHLHS